MPRNRTRPIPQKYVDYLNEVFNQTITASRLILLQHASKDFHITCFQDKGRLPLKLNPEGWLHFRQIGSIQSGKVVVTESRYSYSLSPDPDNEEQWVFRYDYCVNLEKHVPHSHIHLNAARGNQQLRRIHFPTGRVSIEQIIAHLIIEWGIESKRSDWFEYLAESHKGFMERRTDLQSQMFP